MHSRPRLWLVLGLAVTAVLLIGLGAPASGAEDQGVRLYVSIDKAQLIALAGEPISAVSVTNPKIADVQVVTPNQLLVNAKALGATSLVVFYSRNRVQFFDLVVNPAPVVPLSVPTSSPAPHTVLVHRADRLTSHLFVRDGGAAWVELGQVKNEVDDDKKKPEVKKSEHAK